MLEIRILALFFSNTSMFPSFSFKIVKFPVKENRKKQLLHQLHQLQIPLSNPSCFRMF